jgi:hypothetical protein
MRTTNQVNASWSSAMVLAIAIGMLGITTAVPSCYAQTQAQQDAVPPAVANELKNIKTEIGRLESKVNYLAAVIPATAVRSTLPAPAEITLTGRVSCGHCEGIQPLHKGYTPFSWALYSISQGDDIVLVASDKIYKLQGDKAKLLKLMSDRVQVSGRLESADLQVATIDRAPKMK